MIDKLKLPEKTDHAYSFWMKGKINGMSGKAGHDRVEDRKIYISSIL